MSACTETAEGARENLAAIRSTLEDLASDFTQLARHADRLGQPQPAIRLRHMERELVLVVQQADALIGAVLSAETKGT